MIPRIIVDKYVDKFKHSEALESLATTTALGWLTNARLLEHGTVQCISVLSDKNVSPNTNDY